MAFVFAGLFLLYFYYKRLNAINIIDTFSVSSIATVYGYILCLQTDMVTPMVVWGHLYGM